MFKLHRESSQGKFSRFVAQMAHAPLGCAALQNVADVDWLIEAITV